MELRVRVEVGWVAFRERRLFYAAHPTQSSSRAFPVLMEPEPGFSLLFGRVFFTRTGVHPGSSPGSGFRQRTRYHDCVIVSARDSGDVGRHASALRRYHFHRNHLTGLRMSPRAGEGVGVIDFSVDVDCARESLG